jgi:hypothetical protein
MPLGSVRVARLVHQVVRMGSPDGPVHNFIHVTGASPGPQIPHLDSKNWV